MPQPIYLDHAATTPVRPEVREAMDPFFGPRFGNPSSTHRWGREARAALDEARERVAALEAAGVERVMLQHLLHDDLEAIELVGREILPAFAAP